jgi:two-component system nitrogen regulation sensor histidine kinase GlnL
MAGYEAQTGYISEQILDHLSTGILVFDTRLKLVAINTAGEVLLGQSARLARGRTPMELLANGVQMAEQLQRAMETGDMILNRGCRLELPQSQVQRVNCTATPLSGPGGVTGVIAELRTVDHHLRIEQEEQLITQQEASRALVRGLAHEIKNPLGGLRGAAQLLEREIQDASLREYTRIIIGEADRLQNLMNRMLGPNDIPEFQAVNIHTVLERVRELVLAEVGDGLKIRPDYDPSLPELQADPELLLQAALNLVRNAAQALGGSGEIMLRTRVKRQFHIGAHKHRLVAAIDVIDNGPGIPAELQEKIFFPMITTRDEGTGLGLSIAQSLVARHRGLIECNSMPGNTVFTMLLPLDDGK